MFFQKYLSLIISLSFTIWLFSCNTLRYVPEGKQLFTGAKIEIQPVEKIKKKSEVISELEEVIRPKPNKTISGFRIRLWLHYRSQKENASKITKKLNEKYGEEPVYIDQIDNERSARILLNRLENKGYFYSRISYENKTTDRTSSVKFKIKVGKPYRLAHYEYKPDSSTIQNEIEKSLENTLLTEGTCFDVDLLKKERIRIDNYLKERGYYRFNAEYLVFSADTNHYDDRKYDLYLTIKPQMPDMVKNIYRINNVTVFPNYTLGDESVYDTVIVNQIAFLEEEISFKPKHLRSYILIKPDDLYQKKVHQLTTKRLNSIGRFQYVSVRFQEQDSLQNDSTGRIDCLIHLSPFRKQSIRAEMKGVTKSNGFMGPGLSITYKNNNLFKAGEALRISGNVGYETQVANASQRGLNSYQFGLQNQLLIPRLIAPFSINSEKGYSVPKTKLVLNYSLLNRMQYYHLNSLLASYGFQWQSSERFQHELSPVSVNYMHVSRITKEFQTLLDKNLFLARGFENQLIPGLTYMVRYQQAADKKSKHRFISQLSTDVSGNALSLITSDNRLLNLPFAQYAKADLDIRHYFEIKNDRKIATRLFVGAGMPYGNSVALPYIKQYFAGGPNSIRAFRIRSLGPGTYAPEDPSLSFFDQTGDMKIEFNTEYRFSVISFLKGALFFDAGNIWLANDNEALAGGQFTTNWYKELAMGAGYGFRVDVDFLVIRLDVAFPIHNPILPEGDRWQTDYAVHKRDWRRNNLVWNFAIGYPF